MKSYIAIVFLLLNLVSCQKESPLSVLDQDLLTRLQLAEDTRFSDASELETKLSALSEKMSISNSDNVWAKYYFLKAHVEESQSHFDVAVLLIDSARQRGLYQEPVYQARVTLLEAIINEQLLLFEKSREYYEQLCVGNEACLLTPNEKLIAVLGKARIAQKSHMPIGKYLKEADDLLAEHDGMNLGLYYANMAFFAKKNEEKIAYYKLSLRYYLDKDLPIKCFNVYYNLASRYVQVNMDSAMYYIKQAERFNADPSLLPIIRNSRLQNNYHYSSVKIHYYMANYEEALKHYDLALPISESLGLEKSLHCLKSFKSDIMFAQGHYQASKDLAKESYNHHYTYKFNASENQIRYMEAKYHIDDVLKENELSKLHLQNAQLSNRLFIVITSVVSVLLIVLIYRGKAVRDSLVNAYDKLHNKEAVIVRLEDTILNVNAHVEAKHMPESTLLSRIDKEVKGENITLSWDSFYLTYVHKYPGYDQKIKNHFPYLKHKEWQFALCEHYGLSDEKIALIFNVQLATVRKKRQRLRETLSLSNKVDIKDYLSKVGRLKAKLPLA